VDVWESEEAFQRFGQKLMPLLEKAGIPAVAPQVFPIHNVVTQWLGPAQRVLASDGLVVA